MATTAALHHVEACVRDGYKFATTLIDKYRFSLIAIRQNLLGENDGNQWLLHKGYAVFLITQQTVEASFASAQSLAAETVVPLADTFDNIAIQVKYIDACVDRLSRLGSLVITPKTQNSDNGVEYAKVSTRLGNLTYTLISDAARFSSDRSESKENHNVAENYAVAWIKSTWCYSGFQWLDSFASSPAVESSSNTHIDHITLVCERGDTDNVIRWHQDAFGMRRFLMNTQDSIKDGFVVQDASSRRVGGLKLKAMEYFHCAETGICSNLDESDARNSRMPLRIVVAESLPGQGTNQIDAFLEDHKGPGIQHIGLHTADIVDECRLLTTCGVEFQMPPAAYYSQPDKIEEIQHAKINQNLMQRFGILIDSEADALASIADATISEDALAVREQQSRYLMQVFTKPLFDNARTFFLEILQRHGATGFGTGNIKALWRSVQITLEQQERERQQGAPAAPDF